MKSHTRATLDQPRQQLPPRVFAERVAGIMRARDAALVDACVHALLPSFEQWGNLLGCVQPIALTTFDGGPLPGDWSIPLEHEDTIVAVAPLRGAFVGVATLVARTDEFAAA